MKNRCIGLLVMLSILITGKALFAQQKAPSYRSAKPTLSPYLFLTRPQVGFFPNYHTFVEPYRNQTQINQIQQTQISNLNQEVQQQNTLQNKPAAVAPTGHSSVYGNLSHYYSANPGSGSGNRQSKPTRGR
ncbi:MAG: hypothetical protein IT427_19210 [Pirellulales bacterium]|nr:hypothetical protein [Pirellulales bacterium]